MGSKTSLPPELDPVRDAARRALEPITPATKQTRADKNFLFDAKRTEAGRNLPPYYLVYFLLVELLESSRSSEIRLRSSVGLGR